MQKYEKQKAYTQGQWELEPRPEEERVRPDGWPSSSVEPTPAELESPPPPEKKSFWPEWFKKQI